MLQLLTTTGARPEAWALCQRWMARQTYTGPVRWVIVDDGPVAQAVPAPRAGWVIDVIRPKALWQRGMNTQIPNLRRGLRAISDQRPVVIIEDDDHYAPGYLARVAQELQQADLVGQRLCRKYNIRTQRAKELLHPYRASLCATAVRGAALARLRRIVEAGPRLIDGALWRPGLGHLFDGSYVTGIKCLPGRGGIDSGHQPKFGDQADPDWQLLRQWIGADAEDYQMLSPKTRPAATRAGEINAYVEAYRAPNYRMGLRRRTCVAELLKKLPRGSLLDVGTGRGETLDFAAQAGHAPVQGTEVVPYLVGGRVRYAEAHALPFADRSFDHVTCFDVLEHLTEPDIEPALREMLRVAARTVTVSASERSDIREGRELHISKRPTAAWLALIQRCWGPGARQIANAGASPAFQVVLP